MRKLWKFRGGVKLPGYKDLSCTSRILSLEVPTVLAIPLRQHIGEPAIPVVKVGDYVYKGQLIAATNTVVSAPVHASSSGVVQDIVPYVIPHPSGINEPCILIKTDGKDLWQPDIKPVVTPDTLSVEVLQERIRNAGIVGLGGAAFPSSVKLKPVRSISTLIINGVECEPYITCDDLLMQERAEEILRGTLILRRLVSPETCIIAVEDNKRKALEQLRLLAQQMSEAGVEGMDDIRIVAVPTVFPAGGEKQLIKVLTGREVPQHGLPYEIGIVCLNVGTTYAIYDAIYNGRPLISRIVTVTGFQVRQPGNFEVRIGTPVEFLLEAAGGIRSDDCRLIMGGPMMGNLITSKQLPVVKATNCILVQEQEKQFVKPVMPCIRCGACANACPIQLLPQHLYWHARAKNFDRIERYNLNDCIECGCCAVVCPSHIPLVHYFRFAKTGIRENEAKRKFADQSRIRNQMRLDRLEQLKREQEERKARRKAERKNAAKNPAGTDTPVPVEEHPEAISAQGQ